MKRIVLLFVIAAAGVLAAAAQSQVKHKWDNDRAFEEANQLGTISPAMKTFALDYIQSHKK